MPPADKQIENAENNSGDRQRHEEKLEGGKIENFTTPCLKHENAISKPGL